MNRTFTRNVTANATTDTTSSWHRSQEVTEWFATIILTNSLGACANVLLLLSLAIHRPLRRSSSWALITHCIAIDLCMICVAVPNTVIPVYLGPHYSLPANFCTYQTLYVYSAYIASFYASGILAIQRLIATVAPDHFLVIFHTKPIIVVMLIAPWIVSFLFNIFPVLGIGIEVGYQH